MMDLRLYMLQQTRCINTGLVADNQPAGPSVSMFIPSLWRFLLFFLCSAWIFCLSFQFVYSKVTFDLVRIQVLRVKTLVVVVVVGRYLLACHFAVAHLVKHHKNKTVKFVIVFSSVCGLSHFLNHLSIYLFFIYLFFIYLFVFWNA